MRRRLILAVLAAAAIATTSTPAHAASEVVVQLRGGAVGARAPLAALRGPDGRLSTERPAMREALASIAAEQRTVGRALRKAVPGVVVTARLRYTLDALVVYAPAGSLRRLARVHGVEQVYRSASFHVETDRVPTVVNATPLWSPAPAFPDGSRGQGMRIGIIDDGIDIRRPSFSGAGYSYPPGFPKGLKNGVNGKVIVARAFAPPDSGPRAHTAFDPVGSEHGTHVAGIAAGNSGIMAMVDGVRVPNLSGVAPDAYLGSYRVLTTPTPTFGLDGNAAEIARAIDRAVGDGMDVLNLSLGEPEAGPGDDLVERAIAGAARAGVPTVVAAGNEGDEGGFGTVSSPGSAADAITRRRGHERPDLRPAPGRDRACRRRRSRSSPAPCPSRAAGGLDSPCRASTGCGPGATAGSLLLVHLGGGCTAKRAATAAKAADAAGLLLVTTAQGDPQSSDADSLSSQGMPAVVISRRMGAELEQLVAQAGGQLPVTVGNVTESLGSGNGGLTTSFSSRGPAPISLRLKPDVAAPGEGVLSAIPGGYAIWDGTSMASPAVAGAAALLLQRHPRWTPADVRSALELTARPAYANPARTVEAMPLVVGSGLIDVTAADATPLLSNDASANFGLVRAPSSRKVTVELRDAGTGGGVWTVSAPGLSAPPTIDVPPGGSASLLLALLEPAGARARQSPGVRDPQSRDAVGADPLVGLRGAPEARRVARASRAPRRCHRRYPQGHAARLALRVPRSSGAARVAVAATRAASRSCRSACRPALATPVCACSPEPSCRRSCSRATRTGSRARRRSTWSRTPTSTATAIASRCRDCSCRARVATTSASRRGRDPARGPTGCACGRTTRRLRR